MNETKVIYVDFFTKEIVKEEILNNIERMNDDYYESSFNSDDIPF